MAVTAPNSDSDKNMQGIIENGNKETANGNGNAHVEDESPSDEEDEVADAAAPAGAAAKKKKKKKSKKKKVVQTDPPRVPLSKFYPAGNYPTGEIVEYKDDNAYRVTSAEKKHIEQLTNEDPEETYANIRKAAEVHRTVRSAVRKYMRPRVKLVDVAEYIEDAVRALVEHDVEKPLEAGIAFPTGVNVNHCAAHWSPRSGETTVINQGDVIKVDFGVHVKGRIVDSAFTVNFEPTYDVLLEAVRAATNAGVKAAGIDARLGEIAGEIQETMESYEVEVGGKVFPVKPIENLSGHSIHKYQIHGDKSILLVKNDDQRKMEEGEYFAIETFGSTGRGRTVDGPECSHFGKRPGLTTIPPLRLNSAKSLLKTINKNFGTLAFTQRYLERAGESKYILGLNHLISQGILMDYPPLYDQRGSMTAQFEHTILLRPTCKEVVSRGDDY